jgi:hypothetical protein
MWSARWRWLLISRRIGPDRRVEVGLGRGDAPPVEGRAHFYVADRRQRTKGMMALAGQPELFQGGDRIRPPRALIVGGRFAGPRLVNGNETAHPGERLGEQGWLRLEGHRRRQ